LHYISGSGLFTKDDYKFKDYRKKWKEYPENFFVGDFPLSIDIEVTNYCNLKCPYCDTTLHGEKMKRGFISDNEVKKIIDEGSDNGLYSIKFNIRGEPLLHPKIDYFIRYAKQKKIIDVYFNTNAMLLTEEMSERLVDSNLDRISISFDGHNKENYEKNRVGSSFEKVINNVENFRRVKEKRGANNLKIRVQSVMFPNAQLNLKKYKEIWGSIADEINFLDYQDMKYRKEGIKFLWACPQIWQRMGVLWDGTILPCNHDFELMSILGNIKTHSIKQCWNSDKLNEIREKHKTGEAHSIKMCNGCFLRDSEISKLLGK